MKPTLFVLAAGMGSRYGGLKQLDGLGPNGETIMDYSIYDAIRGGFGKLVFVIRKDFEKDFRDKIISKYENHIPVEVVFQSTDKLPEGFTCPADRVKPWGTNHAVLMGKDVINEPFAVINADDFYGRDSFAVIGKYLSELPEGAKNQYAMVGVVERTEIMRVDGTVSYKDEEGKWVGIADNTPVSMNMWGFTPDYFQYSEEYFKEFLKENIDKPKAEFYIPLLVNDLVNSKTATVKVLDTTSRWFGVTYAADRQGVVDKFKALADSGEYPSPLF